MSRKVFTRVETTRNGLDVWLGIETREARQPEELLGWLERMMDTEKHATPLWLVHKLERCVLSMWPRTHYFIEVGYHKTDCTYQIYGDGQ